MRGCCSCAIGHGDKDWLSGGSTIDYWSGGSEEVIGSTGVGVREERDGRRRERECGLRVKGNELMGQISLGVNRYLWCQEGTVVVCFLSPDLSGGSR
jgi:hypothetical protein